MIPEAGKDLIPNKRMPRKRLKLRNTLAICTSIFLASCVGLKSVPPASYPPDPAYQGASYYLNPQQFMYLCDHFRETSTNSNRLWRYFQLVEVSPRKANYVRNAAAKLGHSWALPQPVDVWGGEIKRKNRGSQ